MKIKSIHDKEFLKYGCIVENKFFSQLENASNNIQMQESGCKYVASVPEFETKKIKEYFFNYFGQMDIQLGYCYGYNKKLNALEWHKSSEINIAVTDFILMLGDRRMIDENGIFDTKNMEFFLIKKGEAVELYSTTLHFCPCQVDDKPFKSVVILPKGTNTPLNKETDDKRLTHKNKWLVCHPESETHVKMGRLVGLKGENYTL